MLKLIFALLLAANGLVFALAQGYLGNLGGAAHEPARSSNQLHGEQLKLVAPVSAQAAPTPDAALATPAPTPAPQRFPCTDIGNFALADARRFETKLAALDLGQRQSRRNVESEEVSSYLVYLPAQGNKEANAKQARELGELGIRDYFVLPESSPQHGGISLGVFKLETGAQHLQAALLKQGVRSAKITPRYSSTKLLAFRFRDLDGVSKTALSKIASAFPEQELRDCK